MAAIVKVLLCLLLMSSRLSIAEAIQHCLNFPDPRHGRLVCDSLFHLFCAPECDSGFVFEYKPAVVYMCGPLTGDWFTYPEGEKIPWPDCVRKGSSKVADLHPEITIARRARISQKILESHRGIFPQNYRSAPVDQPDARFNHLFNYIQKAQQMYSDKRTTPSVFESPARRQEFWVQRQKQAMEQKLQLQHRQSIQNLQYFKQQPLLSRAYPGQQWLQQTEWYKPQQQLQQVIQEKLQQNQKSPLPFTDYEPNVVGSSNNIYLQKYQQQKIKTPAHVPRTGIFHQTSPPNQAGRLNYQGPAQVAYSPNRTPVVQDTQTGSDIGFTSGVRTSVNQNTIGSYQQRLFTTPSQKFNQQQRGIFSKPVYGSAFRPVANEILNWGTPLTQGAAAKHVTSNPMNYQQKTAVGITTVRNPVKRNPQAINNNATVRQPLHVNQNTGNNFKNVTGAGGAHTVGTSLPRNKQVKNLFPSAISHTTGQALNLALALKKAHNSTPQIERRGGVDEEPVQGKEEKLKTKEKLFYFPIKRDTLINMLPLELKNRYKILKGKTLNDKVENGNRKENNKQEFLLPGIIKPLSSQNISGGTFTQVPRVSTFDDYKAQNSSQQENNKQEFLLPGIIKSLSSQNISGGTFTQVPRVSTFDDYKAQNSSRQENSKQEFLLPGIIKSLSSQNISGGTHTQGPKVSTFDDYKAQNSSQQENSKQEFLLPGIIKSLSSQNISGGTFTQGPRVSTFDDYKAQNSSRQENSKQEFLLPGIIKPLSSQNLSQVLTRDQGPSVSTFYNPVQAVNTEINDLKFPSLTSASAVSQLAEPAVNNPPAKKDIALRYASVDRKSQFLNDTNSNNSLTTKPIKIQPFVATNVNVIEEYSEEPIIRD